MSRTRATMLAAACVAGGALAVPFGGSPLAVATIGLPGAAGLVATVPSAGGDVPAATDAVALLEQAYGRSRSATYHGVQLVMVDDETHYVRVSHVPGHTYVSADPAGPAGQVYETADSAATGAAGDPLAKDPLALLKEHYRLTVVGTQTLLGRSAVVIAASRPDGAIAAEFWVDRTTSLLLRRETYDTTSAVYSEVSYTSLEVDGTDPSVTALVPATAQPAGTEQDADRLSRLRSRGWWASSDLPGGLTLYDAREVGSGAATVVHLSYSDGISTVSLFEQRGRLAGASSGRLAAGWSSVQMPDGHRVVRADGVPMRAAWQAGPLVVAVIADVPPSTVPTIVDALPYGAAPVDRPTVMRRVGRGLDRMRAMLDPFG